jgi:hypothetical protein
LKARKYAETAGKRLTVGSDSHRLGTIGSSGTYLPAKAHPSSIELFDSFRTCENLRFKARHKPSAAHLPLLGIVALKHTHHFVRGTRRHKRPWLFTN